MNLEEMTIDQLREEIQVLGGWSKQGTSMQVILIQRIDDLKKELLKRLPQTKELGSE